MKTSTFASLLILGMLATGAPAAEVRCEGADLSKLTRSVYVSPQGNDSGSCGGSASSPCKTIQQGITNCTGEGCGVLVRYGVYSLSKPVELVDGVSLYGSCVFDETTYRYRSTIVGRPAIRANGINKPTTVHGFAIVTGANTLGAGEANLAMVVSNSSGLKLSHNVIASGRGGNGANGAASNGGYGGSGSYAINNVNGGTGGRACYLSPPPDSRGDGGRGADYQQLYSSGCFFTCKCTNNNDPASIGKNGMSSGTITGGGGGQKGSPGCACDNRGGGDAGQGPTGDNGKTGACGSLGGDASVDNKGSFAGTVWSPNRSGTGGAGQVGSGGGGGGSGGFGVVFFPTEDFNGYPGGGGGGGGCGGAGGTGGQQGGASIPLVLFNSTVNGLAEANLLVPGPGGRGGNGGTGGKGGNGGSGAAGKTGDRWHIGKVACSGTVPGFGGRGGNGGKGGAGGGGAGGNGGPSFGIALVSSPALPAAGIAIYQALPGEGGPLGGGGQNESSECKGVDGKAGRSGFSNDQNSIVSFSSTQLE